MKALSIRQPWAWLILHAGKDIENRSWPHHLYGPFLIHAAKGMTMDEYHEAESVFVSLRDEKRAPAVILLPPNLLERGGIVGRAEIVDCVRGSKSPWFFGEYGFVLANPKPLPFIPYRGQLGFFDVPDRLLGGAPQKGEGT